MKSLAILGFVIISTIAAEELLCSPNSLFKQDCNSCVCSNDGKTMACTDIACPKEHSAHFCEPSKQFHLDDLSTCVCMRDGKTAMCTLGLQAYGRNRHLTKSSQFCTPGTTFSPDNCNSCHCNQDGTNAFCTLQMCPMEKPKKTCEPNKTFKNYCNICFCDDAGASYSCTRMLCDKKIWNEDGSMKVDIERSSAKQVCEPGEAFNDYCNTCVCSDDGLNSVCTKMFCDKNIWNKDGTRKFMRQSVQDRVCTPNTHFKEQCNACVCSADGLSKFCTMMACDAFESKSEKQVCTPRSTFSPDGCNTCKCDESGTDFVCTFKKCD